MFQGKRKNAALILSQPSLGLETNAERNRESAMELSAVISTRDSALTLLHRQSPEFVPFQPSSSSSSSSPPSSLVSLPTKPARSSPKRLKLLLPAIPPRRASLTVVACSDGSYSSSTAPAGDPSPARALRRILELPGVHQGPACFDALSAKLVERAGFDYCFTSGILLVQTFKLE